MKLSERRARLKWWVLALLLLVGLTIGSRWFWRHAPVYATEHRAAPAVPVMTMEEYGALGGHRRPYVLEYTAPDAPGAPGALLLYGVVQHTSDPDAEDIARIQAEWGAFEPTVALIETRLGLWIAGFRGIVEQFGEGGAVAWLARRDGVPCHTLELPLADEVAGVLESFPPEQVALFYVLRPYLGARRGGPIDDPEGFIAEALRKRGGLPGLDGCVSTVEDVDRVWARDLADLPDWRDCEDSHGWPGVLHDVGSEANLVRNAHWLDVIDELARKGERVFAVVGGSHAVRLEPALGSLLAPVAR
jgi:hypothetical protein